MITRDLSGQRFGRLLVLDWSSDNGNERRWNCKCDCGRILPVLASSLVRKNKASRSCGCISKEVQQSRMFKHGLARSPEYVAWAGAKSRCFNSRNPEWKRYGKRGVTMCFEWVESFEKFYKHIGPRPLPKLTLERINNDGNYEPGNVCWATRKQQAQNMRHRNQYTTYA